MCSWAVSWFWHALKSAGLWWLFALADVMLCFIKIQNCQLKIMPKCILYFGGHCYCCCCLYTFENKPVYWILCMIPSLFCTLVPQCAALRVQHLILTKPIMWDWVCFVHCHILAVSCGKLLPCLSPLQSGIIPLGWKPVGWFNKPGHIRAEKQEAGGVERWGEGWAQQANMHYM